WHGTSESAGLGTFASARPDARHSTTSTTSDLCMTASFRSGPARGTVRVPVLRPASGGRTRPPSMVARVLTLGPETGPRPMRTRARQLNTPHGIARFSFNRARGGSADREAPNGRRVTFGGSGDGLDLRRWRLRGGAVAPDPLRGCGADLLGPPVSAGALDPSSHRGTGARAGP